VQQELTAEIQRTSVWPVIGTVDGHISKPNKTDFRDGDSSYIILIPDGNFQSFAFEIWSSLFAFENHNSYLQIQ
jgi:hypothetical protein